MDSEHMQAIGFDMGGTSTDVSRFAGSYEHVFETTTAGGWAGGWVGGWVGGRKEVRERERVGAVDNNSRWVGGWVGGFVQQGRGIEGCLR